jgi:hypothetical protein
MSKEIIRVLMERDGLTEEEAEERVDEVREMFEDCEYDSTECELIMAEELGLEPDYIFDLLL